METLQLDPADLPPCWIEDANRTLAEISVIGLGITASTRPRGSCECSRSGRRYHPDQILLATAASMVAAPPSTVGVNKSSCRIHP
jgi:hypothetical protein